MSRPEGRPEPTTSGTTRYGADRWGVVMVAHGSQRGTSPRECSCVWGAPESGLPSWCLRCPSTPQGLREAAARLQAELGVHRAQVVLSCLEFIEPRPDQTIHQLASQGFKKVVAIPYLLGQGKHVTLEMDEVLDGVRERLPQVALYLADGLGPDPRLADLVADRVRAQGDPREATRSGNGAIGVLVVKAGTKNQYDDCLWLEDLGRMAEDRLGGGYAAAVAQSHYGDPTVEAGAARLVDERSVSAIVVVPYVFFPGLILKRNILGGMERLRQKYPRLSLAVTPPLGVDSRLVAVAADRVRQVWQWAGDEALERPT